MISPHTPPRTKIVCVDAEDHGRYQSTITDASGLDGLQASKIYTVHEILPHRNTLCGFQVILLEIDRGINPYDGNILGFSLERFRRAELPRCLTDILTGAPIRVTEDA